MYISLARPSQFLDEFPLLSPFSTLNKYYDRVRLPKNVVFKLPNTYHRIQYSPLEKKKKRKGNYANVPIAREIQKRYAGDRIIQTHGHVV